MSNGMHIGKVEIQPACGGPVYLIALWSEAQWKKLEKQLHTHPGISYRLLDSNGLELRTVHVHKTS